MYLSPSDIACRVKVYTYTASSTDGLDTDYSIVTLTDDKGEVWVYLGSIFPPLGRTTTGNSLVSAIPPSCRLSGYIPNTTTKAWYVNDTWLEFYLTRQLGYSEQARKLYEFLKTEVYKKS